MQGPHINGKLRKAFFLAVALATAGCEKHPAQSAFEPDPIVHLATGRVVFNRMCADENPYSVQAYARMASEDDQGRRTARRGRTEGAARCHGQSILVLCAHLRTA